MSNAELQQALEDYRAAESFYNEAPPEQMDRALCRYNAAEARLTWLLRDAKLAAGIEVDWEKLEEKWAMSGNEKIIKCANALLEAITEQGYCVRSQGDFGSVNIYLHSIGTRSELAVENITNAKVGWRISGKLTAPLIAEKEEAGE